MTLANEIDEIAIYRNDNGSYQVNIFTNDKNEMKRTELLCNLLDINIGIDNYGEVEYNLTFKGAHYANL